MENTDKDAQVPTHRQEPTARAARLEALQQLLDVLRSPNTQVQKQNQILHILKSNPPLMATFIKMRKQKLAEQQGGDAGGACDATKADRSNYFGMALNKLQDERLEPKVGVSSSDGPPSLDGSSQQAPAEEGRKLAIQKCIETLAHACQCKNVICLSASCQRMKRVVQHIKLCKKRTAGGCPICKQLVALCCHHARNCPEGKCSVPFCSNIKQKLKHSKQQLHVEEEKMLRQGIALLNLTEPEDAGEISLEDVQNLLDELNLEE